MATREAVKNMIRGKSCYTCQHYSLGENRKKEICWIDVEVGQFRPAVKSLPAEKTCEEWDDV